MYDRNDGKIVANMDDLMSATRYAVQSLNFACNLDHAPSLYTKLQELREFIEYTIENN